MTRLARCSLWIGWDPREADGFAVARRSARRATAGPLSVSPVALDELRLQGLYRRPTERRDGKLWDVISEAPMATEFACSRFLVPHLAKRGWALFVDSDVLVRKPLELLFESLDDDFAVACVKHVHEPPEGVKMDGQAQLRYARKNWSSVLAFNCDHPANRALTIKMINSVPGRDLHRFCWLEDSLIQGLDPKWNWLVGHSSPEIDPAIVHFTEGLPSMPGYKNVPYANEWRDELKAWRR